MFFNAKQLEPGHTIKADICIIGAGAAGITIAREYISTSTRVVLVESGGLAHDAKTQSLYEGNNIGVHTFKPDINRLRYFGGTTNHWAGHCRPLDDIDFEKRTWIPHSGWPISRNDLDPYYIRAQPIVGLGPYEYENLSFWQEETKLPELEFDDNRLNTVVYNQSPPTRFGQEYRKELKDARNISVYLHANVLEIDTNDTATQVTGLTLACIDGPRFSVSATIFVLATGGMENARILLLSNSVNPAGLGNDNDLVGRYFMDHLVVRPGADISLSGARTDMSLYHAIHKARNSEMFAVLAAPKKLLKKEKLNNFRIHLLKELPKYKTPEGSVFSKIDEAGPTNKDHWFDYFATNKERGSMALHLVLEPTPNSDSRITLSNDMDLFRQRKINVRWQVHDKDLVYAHRALELAALEFSRLGIGRAFGSIFMGVNHWPTGTEAGKHHCGTTRMADDPGTGVVDKNCRVHAVSNLYIAGSSVFPTIGYANPTLSIVALALRLADHTKAKLNGKLL
jgi:choline dehydrogenase-like flavoprotein